MVEAEAPETVEAMTVEAGAPEITEADVMVARPSAQEAEMKAAEALVAPLVQGPPLLRESAREAEVYPISSDDTSWAQGVVDAEETGAVEQPAPTLGEGSSALVWVRPEPRGWVHPRVLWWSRDDPEGEPLFALEDVAEGGVLELSRAIPPTGGAVAVDSAVRCGQGLAQCCPGTCFPLLCHVLFFRVLSQ